MIATTIEFWQASTFDSIAALIRRSACGLTVFLGMNVFFLTALDIDYFETV